MIHKEYKPDAMYSALICPTLTENEMGYVNACFMSVVKYIHKYLDKSGVVAINFGNMFSADEAPASALRWKFCLDELVATIKRHGWTVETDESNNSFIANSVPCKWIISVPGNIKLEIQKQYS